MVRQSDNIVKVLTLSIHALEAAHCSLIPRASSPVRELRNRSCCDSLLVKASKIPRESMMSIPPTFRQLRPSASVASKHRLTKQAVPTRGIRQQTQGLEPHRCSIQHFSRQLKGSPCHHADIVFLTMSEQLFFSQSYPRTCPRTIWSGTIDRSHRPTKQKPTDDTGSH